MEKLVGLHLEELTPFAPYTVEYRMDPYPSDPLFNSTPIADPFEG